jgi:hypothetical protein
MLAVASWRRGLAVLERTQHAGAVVTATPNDPSFRATSVARVRGAVATLSAIPLGSNRRGG